MKKIILVLILLMFPCVVNAYSSDEIITDEYEYSMANAYLQNHL